ncbi:hypothetical protein [uncultured Polaribacter sp.]|uniref:hypothetical protein n=1 Tax=uncultured Polaribacter sp. TaxID=174711 RepID=UPI00259BBE33|nr:hypothetical protein [uncultured Polaribacter sp.]
MKEIIKIDLSPKVYGGRIYENEVVNQLKEDVNFKKVYLIKYKFKLLNAPRIILLFIKYRYFFKGELFLNDRTTFLAGKKSKNYIIIHHIDSSYSSKLSIYFHKITFYWLRKNKNLFHKVIAVSEYWKNHLIKVYNFNFVEVIYNSFDLNDYKIDNEEKKSFFKKYNLDSKPIIYIGNAQEKKGVIDVFNSLKEVNAHIITSGRPQVKIDCLNLNLSHREYLVLLSVSKIVITMSKFLEGWNRTAHEAILLNTTVIGSGKGGMRELLEKSSQFIIKDFDLLKDLVLEILGNNKEESKNSDFINSLDLDYFKSSWISIFES